MSGWELFSSHGLVLIYFSRHPRARLRDAADAIGLTERAVQNNIRDLAASGHLVIEKVGRRNRYKVVGRKHLTHPTTRSVSLRQLLKLFKISDVEAAALVTPVAEVSDEAEVAAEVPQAIVEEVTQSVAEPAWNTDLETQSEPEAEIKKEVVAVEPAKESSAETIAEVVPASSDKPDADKPEKPEKSEKKIRPVKAKDKNDDGLPQQDLLF